MQHAELAQHIAAVDGHTVRHADRFNVHIVAVNCQPQAPQPGFVLPAVQPLRVVEPVLLHAHGPIDFDLGTKVVMEGGLGQHLQHEHDGVVRIVGDLVPVVVRARPRLDEHVRHDLAAAGVAVGPGHAQVGQFQAPIAEDMAGTLL